MEIRRVVTGHDEHGRSRVVSDGLAPRTHDFVHIPGFSNTVVWARVDGTTPAAAPADITPGLASLMPAPGGSALTIVKFPPAAVVATLDGALAEEEQAQQLPGLVETFDPGRPGFHTTQTVDYQIVLSGELWLELDTGEVVVREGDVVIQNGTSHAWTNKTDSPAVLAAVSIGTPPTA